MADRFFECTVTITRTCRVRVPADDPEIVYPGEDPEEVAQEFAAGGKRAWPNYVLSEDDEDYTVESHEVTSAKAA